ncbi:MAG: hypothetical protein KIT54_06200 [Phycisphaeraceae bacterium]|nr:hypothetical protein [Phycisphaeraceae bacterium]
MSLAIVLVGLVVGIIPVRSAPGQATFEWVRETDGSFFDANRWRPSGVPGLADTALFSGLLPYAVTLDRRHALERLDLDNPLATLVVGENVGLRVGEIVGSGTVVVRPSFIRPGMGLWLSRQGTEPARLNATIELDTPRPGSLSARLNLGSPGRPAIIEADGQITGRGWISGEAIHRGRIEAVGTIPDEDTTLTIQRLSRIEQGAGGTISAIGTGLVLLLSDATIAGGVVRSEDGGLIESDNAWLEGVRLVAPREGQGTPGRLIAGGVSGLLDATLEGTWHVPSSRGVNVWGTLSGPGELVLNARGEARGSNLTLREGAVLDIPVRAMPSVGGPFEVLPSSILSLHDTATIGQGAIVTGDFTIGGRLTNHGLLDYTGPGARLRMDAAFVTQGDSGRIRASGARVFLNGSTIRGGTWIAGEGDQRGEWVRIAPSNIIADARLEGHWALANGGHLMVEGVLSGPGRLVINGTGGSAITSIRPILGARLEVDTVLNGGGADRRSAQLYTRPSDPPCVIGPAATLSGRGQFSQGRFLVEGTLSPGHGPGGLGEFEIFDTTIVLADSAVLAIDAAGREPHDHDRLLGDGTLVLGGTLGVRFTGGYQPAPGDRLTLASMGTVVGAFDRFEIDPVPDVGPAHVVYGQDRVLLVACAADRDGDGELTALDAIEFQNQFSIGDLRADLDGDGALTLLDWLLFQTRFAAGCR